MVIKTNEKQNIEDALCEENILDILKNVQCGPTTYSKVKFSFNIYRFLYFNFIVGQEHWIPIIIFQFS